MAINFPGPFEVRIRLLTNEPAPINEHQIRVSCDIPTPAAPGDPFSDWFPVMRNGGVTTTLAAHVEALLNVTKVFYNTLVAINLAELWEYTPGTFDATFRAAYAPTADAGTAAGATVSASQTILSMRTIDGGVMKYTMMGTSVSPDPKSAVPGANASINALLTHFLAATSPWIARDGSFPLVGMFWLPGQNEALWKRLNR